MKKGAEMAKTFFKSLCAEKQKIIYGYKVSIKEYNEGEIFKDINI